MISPDFQDIVRPENYAEALLINSSLELIFTLIYVLLLGLFVFNAARNPTYVLWIAAFSVKVCWICLGPGADSTRRVARDGGGTGKERIC